MAFSQLMHVFIVACPWGLGAICSAFSTIGKAATAIAQLVENPIEWAFDQIYEKGVKQFLTGAISEKLSGPYQNAFDALLPTGYLIAAMSGAMRIVKGVYDDRVDGIHVITDTLVRFCVVILILGLPGASLSWDIISFLVGVGSNATITAGSGGSLGTTGNISQGLIPLICNDIITTLGSSAVWGGGFNFANWLTTLGILAVGSVFVPTMGWIAAICLIVILLGLVYIAGLLVLRMCMLTFAIALAPVCIGTAAFDMKNKFFQWWSELFTACLLIPIVTTTCLIVTAGTASRFSPAALTNGASIIGNVWDVIITTVVIMLGIWFTGKMIHQLTWRHFSHGGITGAITAASTTAMAIPNIANDARAMAGAMGFKVKPGGLLDSMANVRQNQFGLKDHMYRGGSGSPGGDAGSPGSGGGLSGNTVGGVDMASSLSGTGQASVAASRGGAAGFNQFMNKALGNTQGGQMIAHNMASMPPQLQSAIAGQMVGHYLNDSVAGAAATAQAFVPAASAVISGGYTGGGAAPTTAAPAGAPPAAAAPPPAAPASPLWTPSSGPMPSASELHAGMPRPR